MEIVELQQSALRRMEAIDLFIHKMTIAMRIVHPLTQEKKINPMLS
jgi:hypothetical protein